MPILTSELIERFNLQVDDSSELSGEEELGLANEVYGDVQNDRSWEWLKKTFTGTMSTSLDYIDLPVDFKYLVPNKDERSVVFVGAEYSEYKVVGFSQRREYRNQNGYCYIDQSTSRLYFTLQPISAKSVEYDYIKVANALTVSTAPIFAERFSNIIPYGMAAKFNPIELSDKQTSYQLENSLAYRKILSDMQIEDAYIKLSTG